MTDLLMIAANSITQPATAFRNVPFDPLDHHFHMIIACSTFSVSRILEMYPLDHPLNYLLGHPFHMIIAVSTFSVSTNSEMTPLNYLFHEGL